MKEVILRASELLKRNLERQEEVSEEISSITQGRVSEAMKEVQENSIARKSLAVFNPPYFKDVKGFSHPANEDTIAKR